MSQLKSFFNKGSDFQTDYRDTILYNGFNPFYSTGKFIGDLLEFYELNNPENRILFNPNLKKQQYIDLHDNYDLVRNKEGKSFATFEVKMAQGNFLPTGRTFMNEVGLELVWEFMQKNNPESVVFLKLPLNENFITGKQCLEKKIIIKFDDFLDRNPTDQELDNFMTQMKKIIRDKLSLNNIYLGYNLLTKVIFDEPGMAFMGSASVGQTATLGFSKDVLENCMMQSRELYLCYIALPIDDDDYLIESDMLDWEFENFLTSQFRREFVSVGAISKNEFKRCRTFKFLYQKQ